jgi:hypothetical protein
MKLVLRKRLELADDLPDAVSKADAAALYLELSWFIDKWDELDCANVHSPHPYRETLPAIYKRLLNCWRLEQAHAHVKKTRAGLVEELKSFGVKIADVSGIIEK